jgi:uncharacterized membrane protein
MGRRPSRHVERWLIAMRGLQILTLVAATVATGLVAGLFGAFACAVMPALDGADDRTLVDTMQRVNRAILNPVFLGVFVGALPLTIATGALHVREEQRDALPWIVAGLVLYVLTLVITGRFNVPLNQQLDAAGDPGRITDLHAVRDRFESTWVKWNVVRTVTNVAACCCLAYALIVSGRSTATDERAISSTSQEVSTSAPEMSTQIAV